MCFPLVNTVTMQMSIISILYLRSTFLAKNEWMSYAAGVYIFHLTETKLMIFIEHQVLDVTVQ